MTARYEVWIKRSAGKELAAVPPPLRDRLIARIRSLADDPRPVGTRKLVGRDAWRLRVGAYRVVYTIEDQRLVVEVVRVAARQGVSVLRAALV